MSVYGVTEWGPDFLLCPLYANAIQISSNNNIRITENIEMVGNEHLLPRHASYIFTGDNRPRELCFSFTDIIRIITFFTSFVQCISTQVSHSHISRNAPEKLRRPFLQLISYDEGQVNLFYADLNQLQSGPEYLLLPYVKLISKCWISLEQRSSLLKSDILVYFSV